MSFIIDFFFGGEPVRPVESMLKLVDNFNTTFKGREIAALNDISKIAHHTGNAASKISSEVAQFIVDNHKLIKLTQDNRNAEYGIDYVTTLNLLRKENANLASALDSLSSANISKIMKDHKSSNERDETARKIEQVHTENTPLIDPNTFFDKLWHGASTKDPFAVQANDDL